MTRSSKPDDIYRILGVRRNASPEAITNAYRRRARTAHPDAGGSQEEFEALHRAYKVLGDPERRARYDATGEIGNLKPDNGHVELMTLLSQVLHSVLQPLVSSGAKPEHVDLVDRMRQVLVQQDADMRRNVEKMRRNKAVLESVAARFQANEPGQENYLEQIARAPITQIEASISQQEGELVKVGRALELLAKFRYRVDPRPGAGGFWASTHGASVTVDTSGPLLELLAQARAAGVAGGAGTGRRKSSEY